MKTLMPILLTAFSCLLAVLLYNSTTENVTLKNTNSVLVEEKDILQRNNAVLTSNNEDLRHDLDEKDLVIDGLRKNLEGAEAKLVEAKEEIEKLKKEIQELQGDLVLKDSVFLEREKKLQVEFQKDLADCNGSALIKMQGMKRNHQIYVQRLNREWENKVKNMYYSFPPVQLDFLGRKLNAKPVRLDSSETQMRISAKLPENYGDMVIDVSIAIILLTILTAALQGLFRKRRRFRL